MGLGFFKSAKSDKGAAFLPGTHDPQWTRSPNGKFHKLSFLNFDASMAVGGVYVVWHGGIRPQWVYVGASDNVGQALEKLLDNREIMDYDVHGGLFATWSKILPEFRPGVLRHLKETMQPLVNNPAIAGDPVKPIAVLLPGSKR